MTKLREYNQLRIKEDEFNSFVINTSEEFDEWHKNINQISKSQSLIFRGQSEARYKIYSSAQRLWMEKGFVNTINDSNASYHSFIFELIQNCREWQSQLLNNYFFKLDHDLTDLALLAIMQHYGLPTPLIDFTKELDISLYFAVSNLKHNPSEIDIDDYFSIYCINLDENNEQILHLTSLYDIEKDSVLSFKNLVSKERLIFMDTNDNKALNLIHYSNFNIINQKGVFLFNYHPWKYVASFNTERRITKDTKVTVNFPNFSKDVPILKHMHCANIHKSLKEYILGNYLSSYSDNKIYPSFEDLKNYAVTKSLKEINKIK